MRQHAIWSALILAGALIVPCTAFSADPAAFTPYQNDAGIAYMSGGVGLDEREAIHGLAMNYNLRLVFADRDGAYFSDVKVDIRDSSGREILSAVSNGPWFFAKLPSGRYKITAEAGGRISKTQSAVIGRERQKVLRFYWAD